METREEWCCEAVWDGPFEDGDFDRTDVVFGSGVRLRHDEVVFVSSGSTVDRLHSIERDGRVFVSNSLPLILTATDGALNLRCTDYLQMLNSIMGGLRRYQRQLPTTAGPVGLTYFDNILWDGHGLRIVEKPAPARDFHSFTTYRGFLSATMATLAANATDTERRRPFGLISTLSSGYDSTATSVLAREAGCEEAFGFDRGLDGGDDSGRVGADALGLSFHSVDTSAWRSKPEALIPFLAAGSGGGASVPFHGAATHLHGRVVFTGYNGDRVWAKKPKDLSPWLVRSDVSGLGLTEYRLGAAFINCPVPFLAARQIRDIHAISTSSDLVPWDHGGSYSRPIPRRIVEEAGVPRDVFAVRKQVATGAILRPIEAPPADLRGAYFDWVRRRRWDWVRRGRVPPMPRVDAVAVGLDTWARGLVHRLATLLRRRDDASDDQLLASRLRKHRMFRWRRIHQFVIHWAIEEQMRRYAEPLRDARLHPRTPRMCASTPEPAPASEDPIA